MAKLHGAAKAAFLARMARGRKKTKRRSRRANPKRSRSKRRRNPITVASAKRRYRKGGAFRKSNRKRSRARAPKRRKNPIAYLVNPTGGTMARKRRKKHTRKANPRRRRHARRHNARRHRHTRRRNPGLLGGLNLKAQLVPAGAALAGGFVGGLVEAKLSHMNAIASKIGQLVAGIGGGLLVSKVSKSANAGAAFMGAVVGGLSRPMGEKVGGGVASLERMEQIASLAATEEGYGLLLNQHMSGYGLILGPMNGGMADSGAGAQLDAMADEMNA